MARVCVVWKHCGVAIRVAEAVGAVGELEDVERGGCIGLGWARRVGMGEGVVYKGGGGRIAVRMPFFSNFFVELMRYT